MRGASVVHGDTSAPAGKVLWHVTMSLDGFIAGPGDSMAWMGPYIGPNTDVDEVLASTGAVVMGRRSYDIGKPYGGVLDVPVFVLTHSSALSDGVATPDGVTIASGAIGEVIASGLDAAAGKNVAIIGASVARQCVEIGLVDELLVHLAPVLLGDGVRLFERVGGPVVEFTPMGVSSAGPITNLRFRRAG